LINICSVLNDKVALIFDFVKGPNVLHQSAVVGEVLGESHRISLHEQNADPDKAVFGCLPLKKNDKWLLTKKFFTYQ